MNVLFVCQCEKRALTETRRILDQFAERRGDRTWQTSITQEGLNTVRKLLRQTARKNTAVACHWIRGLDHSEMLWVVGDASQFSPHGAVPTNTTQRNVLRSEHENDWHSGQDIHLLTVLAALLHDLGKASVAFQKRLRGEWEGRNIYRHEWVSLRLFQAFVGQDSDAAWLARLAKPSAEDDATWLSCLQRDGVDEVRDKHPFAALQHAPLAQALAWLVVTHHRLPQEPRPKNHGAPISTESQLKNVLHRITADWNEDARPHEARADDETTQSRAMPKPLAYWDISPQNLPVTTPLWRKRAARVAQGLLKRQAEKPAAQPPLHNPYVMHLSRLCLMLADHHYSSLGVINGKPQEGRVQGAAGFAAYANTRFDQHQAVLNQPLDEHLLGVAQHGGEITRALPSLCKELPHLARHKGLKKPSTEARFRWQNKATDLAAGMRMKAQNQGAFIVNLASTGCGKTLANARIMNALADPAQGMRCAFAMGLRALTLQTGRAFQGLLGLGDDELAICVGGAAHRALFEEQMRQAELSGSASGQALLDEDSHVLFEGNPDDHPLLRRVLRDPHAQSLIAAPVLVCTIDHLMPATESIRGGHQMAPMLRLMSGDLVLDEPDDFDMSDLPALTRLVFWAGLLGARVLLSSATLPPDLVQGLFAAYREGRQHYQDNRGEVPHKAMNVCCLWVDEFAAEYHGCADVQAFGERHQHFARQRVAALQKPKSPQHAPPRLAQLAMLDLASYKDKAEELPQAFAQRIVALATALHNTHHSTDPSTDKRVSFGLVRMANIQPLAEVALALYRADWPGGVRVHLCTYHSQYPLLLRSRIEQQLDTALNRKAPLAVFDLPDIRQRLDAHPQEADHLFIVLGSPVTEVGRDHDYDWAIVEPSSMRSLIQLAGRVRRHRPLAEGETITAPNVRVFQYNLKHWKNPGEVCFLRPGFESPVKFQLRSHNLFDLLRPLFDEPKEQGKFRITAAPRLLPDSNFKPTERLADLEHLRMQEAMQPRSNEGQAFNAATCWHTAAQDATTTATLPRSQRFRQDDGRDEVEFRLMPDEDADHYRLERVVHTQESRGRTSTKAEVWVHADSELRRIEDAQVQGPHISPWNGHDYLQALTELAEQLDMPLQDCAQRFGRVTLKESKSSAGDIPWRFHPALGFTRAP